MPALAAAGALLLLGVPPQEVGPGPAPLIDWKNKAILMFAYAGKSCG